MAIQNKDEEPGNNSSIDKTTPQKASSRKKREKSDSDVKTNASSRGKRKIIKPSTPDVADPDVANNSASLQGEALRKTRARPRSTKKTIEKNIVSEKTTSDSQASLFPAEPVAAATSDQISSTQKKLPIDAKAKLYTQVLSSVHGQELRDFSTNLANIFDEALIEAIKFIENSNHETLVLISGKKDAIDIASTGASNDSKYTISDLKKIDPSLIKRDIKNIFTELDRKYNFSRNNRIENGNEESEDNESDLLLFCNIIRLSLQWCCELITGERYTQRNITSEGESLKYVFYKTIIDCICANLKSSPVSIQRAGQLIETKCLTLVKGIIDFSNDIDAISSNIQLRPSAPNVVEFRISRFAQQGMSDWIKNYNAIVSYDNSLSQNLIGVEILLNENNISAFIATDEGDRNKEEFVNQNTNHLARETSEELITEIGVDNFTETASTDKQLTNEQSLTSPPYFDAEEYKLQKSLDNAQAEISSPSKEKTKSKSIGKNINYIYNAATMFFIILFLVSLAYIIKIDKSIYSRSGNDQITTIIKEPGNYDLSNMENILYSSPEIGKLLALYKSYFNSDYEIMIRNLYNKGYASADLRDKNNALLFIIDDIAKKRKSKISKLQLFDMDKIIKDENALAHKLVSIGWRDCGTLLVHTEQHLIKSKDLSNYLPEIVNVSMSELDATQNAYDQAENRQFVSDKDMAEIQNKLSSMQNSISDTSFNDYFFSGNLEKNHLSCAQSIALLDLILSLPDRIRFKIEQQVLSQ